MRQLFWTIIIAVGAVAISPAFAGGPWAVDAVKLTGTAARWENDKIDWYIDEGDLSERTKNEEARGWVTQAADKWKNITMITSDGKSVTTSLSKSNFKGSIGKDIANCKDTTDPADTRGQCAANQMDYKHFLYGDNEARNVIIFDDTGEIIAAAMGSTIKQTEKIIGITPKALKFDSTGLKIKKGIMILNGNAHENKILAPDNSTRADELFKATILHEFGHLLNLDHSQVNQELVADCDSSSDCEGGNDIPTMYPIILAPGQGILSADDKVTLSWIYPTEDFTNKFCTITGAIYDSEGRPLKGVNVIASRQGSGQAMSRIDARASVSGVMKPLCVGDSKYFLKGIIPGHKYKVKYESINFKGASSFEPLEGDEPKGFEAGTILSASGEETVSCDSGGQLIELPVLKLEGVESTCVPSGKDIVPSESDDQKSKSCGMIEGSEFSLYMLLYLFIPIILLFVRFVIPERYCRGSRSSITTSRMTVRNR